MLRLHATPADLADVMLGTSAIVEASAALRLLADPAPDALRDDWIRAARRDLRRCGLALAPALHEPGRYVPDFLPPPPCHPPDVRRDLQVLRREPEARVRYHLAHAYPDGVPRDVALLERQPRAGLDRLAGELAALWRAALAPLWPAARAIAEADLLVRAERLATAEPGAVLADLHPAIRLRGSVLEIDGLPDGDVELQGQGFFLAPTAFAGPQVRVVTNGALRTGIAYEPRGVASVFARPRRPRRDGLAAVAGPARARLLRALLVPSATQDLAERLGVTPGAVSQQLRILDEAGLVRGTRRGRRVVYALSEEGRVLLAVFTRATRSGPPI